MNKDESKNQSFENMQEYILQNFQKYDTVVEYEKHTSFIYKDSLVRIYRSNNDYHSFELNIGKGMNKVEFAFTVSIWNKIPSIVVSHLDIDDYLHIPVYILKTFEACDKAYSKLFEEYKKKRAGEIENKLRDLEVEKEKLEKESEQL